MDTPVITAASTAPTYRTRRTRRRVLAVLATAAVLGLTLTAAPAHATGTPPPGTVTEYPLPLAGATACEVEVPRPGVAWVQAIATGNLVRVDLGTGATRTYTLPDAATTGGMDTGPDGNLWMISLAGNKIFRINPGNGAMTAYPLPWGVVVSPKLPVGVSLGEDLEFGDDGNAYFTLIGLNAIGKLNINTGQFGKYPIPTALSGPLIIKKGPPGKMVWVESLGDKVGMIDEATDRITEYPVSTPAALPLGITTAPDGAVWYSEAVGQAIDRLDPATGQTTRYPLPIGLIGVGNPLPSPGPLKFGTDGKLYVAQGPFFAGDAIGQFNPSTHAYHEFALPTPLAAPCDLSNQVPGEILAGELVGGRLAVLHYS
jgi:virginiamycin B lyase